MGGATSQLHGPSAPAEVTVLSAGNVFVDLSNYRAMVAGQPTELTYLEFELLRLFVNRANRIIAYDELTRTLWSSRGRRERRRLAVMVCRLRAKLAASWPHRIEDDTGAWLRPPAAVRELRMMRHRTRPFDSQRTAQGLYRAIRLSARRLTRKGERP